MRKLLLTICMLLICTQAFASRTIVQDWTDLKSTFQNKGLTENLKWNINDNDYYVVWFNDGFDTYETTINHAVVSSNRTDFEDNFQTSANNVETVRVSGLVEVTNNVSIALYTTNADKNIVGTVLNTSTDSSLFSFTGRGVLTFIAISGSSSNYEVAVNIDGQPKLRISMTELGSDLGLANGEGIPIWTETANKNFRLHPNIGIGFTSSFEVIAKSTSATPTVKHLIAFREQE